MDAAIWLEAPESMRKTSADVQQAFSACPFLWYSSSSSSKYSFLVLAGTEFFFFSSSKINKYYFIIFLRRPILDPKIPLMGLSQTWTRTIKGLTRREWFSGCSHMVGSSRINEEDMCWCAASLQCMAFPLVFFIFFFFFRVIRPCASRYRNVMILQKKIHFIKLSSHTGAF